MNELLLSPPAAFLIVLAVSLGLSYLSAPLAFRRKAGLPGPSLDSYACGEEVPPPRVQPDYSQFCPFAFFFPILHVVALMVATVPTATAGSLVIAVVYLLGAIFGLYLLFGRNN